MLHILVSILKCFKFCAKHGCQQDAAKNVANNIVDNETKKNSSRFKNDFLKYHEIKSNCNKSYSLFAIQ